MVYLFTTLLLRFAIRVGVPLTAICVGIMAASWAVRGKKTTGRVLRRMILLSLLIALFVCLLLALGVTWMLYDFHGPDYDPPSG